MLCDMASEEAEVAITGEAAMKILGPVLSFGVLWLKGKTVSDGPGETTDVVSSLGESTSAWSHRESSAIEADSDSTNCPNLKAHTAINHV